MVITHTAGSKRSRYSRIFGDLPSPQTTMGDQELSIPFQDRVRMLRTEPTYLMLSSRRFTHGVVAQWADRPRLSMASVYGSAGRSSASGHEGGGVDSQHRLFLL